MGCTRSKLFTLHNLENGVAYKCSTCVTGANRVGSGNGKCNLCKTSIILDDSTAVTWLTMDCDIFSRDDVNEEFKNIHLLRGFNIYGHKSKVAEEHSCYDFFCRDCQVKTGTYIYDTTTMLNKYNKNLGYINNIRVKPFTYVDKNDNKTYYVPGITSDITDTEISSCLFYYLDIDDIKDFPSPEQILIKENQLKGLLELFSLNLRTDQYAIVSHSDILKVDKLIESALANKKRKKKMLLVLNSLLKKSFGYFSVTGLPKPLVKIIYEYNPLSRYWKFFSQLPSYNRVT